MHGILTNFTRRGRFSVGTDGIDSVNAAVLVHFLVWRHGANANVPSRVEWVHGDGRFPVDDLAHSRYGLRLRSFHMCLNVTIAEAGG